MKNIFAVFSLLILTTTYTQAQNHACYVRQTFVDTQTRTRSSYSRIGEFQISLADEEITKSFLHDESNVTVNVGVQYLKSSLDKKNAGIVLAVAFSGKSEDVFDEVGRAEAQSYGRDLMKQSLMVSKNVEVGSRIWTFWLSCVPNKKARDK